MDKPSPLPAILCLVVVGTAVVPAATAGTAANAAAGQYDVAISGSVETPARTVTFQDRTHEVVAVGVADPGETVSVDVTAPDESYRVYVYNGDERIVESKRGSDDGRFSFDLSNYDPGSYVVAVYHDGEYEAIHPLVVRGYDVSVDHRGSVTAGESVDITVELTETADVAAPDGVDVALVDETRSVNATATRESETTYAASAPTDALDEGTHYVYAGVRTDETAFGERAIVGVSGASTVEVTAPDSTTTSPPSTTTSRSTTTPPETTARPTMRTTDASTPTTGSSTPTGTSATTPETTTPTSNSSTPTTGSDGATTATDDSVLSPNPSTTDRSASTGQPGIGPAGAALAVVAGAALAIRRRY